MTRPWWLILALGGCEREPRPPATPETPETRTAPATDAWRCFARDPSQPALPQGDVTHTRQRLAGGTLAVETVHVQAGRAGATRLVFEPRNGRLETTFGGVPVAATLHAPDASRWSLSYADPASGLEFTEDNVIDASGVLTVTSTDPGDDGPVTTAVRFVPTSCSNVVAELAKYP